MIRFLQRLLLVISFLFLVGCATYQPQYSGVQTTIFSKEDVAKEIAHTFYLIGDAGKSPIGSQTLALQLFKQHLVSATKNSTVLFLGDNIYPRGLPKKEAEGRAFAEHQLNVQTSAAANFKGQTIFIPGNHDWYSNGIKGLKRQEKYIEDILGKNTFLPEDGCPLKQVKINDEVVLIIVDSEWYLTNWDKHPGINDDCEIKTREKFFDEFEGLMKKHRGKTTVITLHHPMFSNGPHGGQFSLKQQLFPTDNGVPLPILGTLANLLRKTGGVSTTDIQNKLYQNFRKRIITLAQENQKAIFVSGHEHSLQYIVKDNLPQIISGSGSKVTATRNVNGGQFSYGGNGFAKLEVFADGSSKVTFLGIENEQQKELFATEVFPASKPYQPTNYKQYPKEVTASIYSKEETTKGGVYRFLWGDRYRQYFSTAVTAPTVNLDTLFGGLTPDRKGGGNQSKTLRLLNKEGKEYVMRALRKSPLQYLQSFAFKDQYIEGQFNDTYTESLLLDAFTGSHPYAPFVIGSLSDAVEIYHTNPTLYYIPKQEALKEFNEEFGNELYMIEERTTDGHGDQASFGFSDELISTDDFLKNLRKDEKYVLDEASYIRARLFDMLIGDWDRHEDQWRWAAFKKDGKIIYRPVPRDRDQAFSVMNDGFLLGLASSLVPAVKLLQSYDDELTNVKWFNMEPYPLDVTLMQSSEKNVWDAQVKKLQEGLTTTVIDNAFLKFPKEVQTKTIQDIKQRLLGRVKNLQRISDTYYALVSKYVLVTGTDKDDWFTIERLPNGETKVSVYRIKKDKKADLILSRTFSKSTTKEIWLYGLDDKDYFEVIGNGDNYIKLRLIGGNNNDTYVVKNTNAIKVYEFASKKNTFKGNVPKKLTDDYEVNVYNHKKLKYNQNQIIPVLGTNPDDGFKIGLTNTYTHYGFKRNPFTSRHIVDGAYYFATSGYELNYTGEFANIFGSWNLGIDAAFTSPNYSINFFGFGNETVNNDESLGLDYNRVKLATIKFMPSLIWRGRSGGSFKLGASYQNIEVEETQGRFINTILNNANDEIKTSFTTISAAYDFTNKDNTAFPTMGMQANLQLGFTANTKDINHNFTYVIPSLAVTHKLNSNGQLVLATKVKSHINIGNGFEFYQAASLGANDGLRGYRNQRFTGRTSFYHTTDIRYNFTKAKTRILPINIGLYGGLDYGRIWIKNDPSEQWYNSIGGGFFVTAAEKLTANVSYFNSNDGGRIAFRFGFGF